MITRVVMPKLTDTMEQGVLVEWKKREGDAIDAGDVLAEIETDKAVMDLESFGSGTLRRILASEGETVDAGALIAVIAEEGEDIDAALSGSQQFEKSKSVKPQADEKSQEKTPEPQKAQSPEKPEAKSEENQKEPSSDKPQAKTSESKPSKPAAKVTSAEKSPEQPGKKTQAPAEKEETEQSPPPIISPRARALAEKSEVDWTTIRGSGPGGRIVERDILEALNSETSTERKQEAVEKPLSQMRKAIARITTESKGPVPHFYLMIDIGMREAEKLQTQLEKTTKKPVSLTVLILKAVAEALRRHPEINVSYAGESLRQHRTIDIGIAVALEDGLITPVVRNCGKKSIGVLAQDMHRLIERTKNRQLTPEEYTGATFSISNLGMYDIENFIAVLMPPQAASLAVGAVQTVPVIKGRKLKADRRMKVTLSCDHRVLDGAQGARFLKTLKEVLENPLELIIPKQ
ncbi:MAG: 2-oxo acid dehydrogenase subunit E2 [Nitrospirales bacterium]|nr:2-oxo acid dehydrogenase subunit E2 [Nitrospirales bacterium]